MKSVLIAMLAMLTVELAYNVVTGIISGEPDYAGGTQAMIMCGIGYLAWRIEEIGK